MEGGQIQPVEISEEVKKSYLDYAMSVIVARALPDVRDGLKPVHRRILYSMHQMGLAHGSHFAKTAKIVGECLGKYHPHGDTAIYDALVRLAQDFSMRYPLIQGQGNFGSIDGDSPAAMRYTEARLAAISAEMLADLDKETADFLDNFDGTLQEPVYLPSKLPNLLLMGSEGIAVGMATKIPPHNLGEVIEATRAMIEKGKLVLPEAEKNQKSGEFQIKKIDLGTPEEGKSALAASFDSPVTIEEITKYIKGPDFPTGGMIFNKNDILAAYATGRGKIVVRGVAEIEESKSGRFQIVIREIPYQVNKAAMVAHIAHLVRERKIEGVADLRDESDRSGLRVVLDLKKDAKPKAILNNLYKHSDLQTTFPVNTVVLVDGNPQLLNLKQILMEFIKHRQKVVTKRTIFDLKAARERSHILEGLRIALDNLDAVIATIKKSASVDEARLNLMKKFSLTEIQANAILEMQLRRLAALERKKIGDEYKEVGKLIEYLRGLLVKPEKILKVIETEIEEVKKKYADGRKTKVFAHAVEEFSQEDLVAAQDCLITTTQTGYIKRLPVNAYRSQRRGGKGVTGMTTKEADEVAQIMTVNTHDNLLFFTDTGRVFAVRAWEINEGSRVSKGQAVINLIDIGADEKIQAVLNLPSDLKNHPYKYLLMVTAGGLVKKTALSSFSNIRSSGIIAIKLSKNDQLCWVKPTSGDNHILLVSNLGKSIKFNENNVRPMGRDTIGVRGIRLGKGDCVVGMEILPSKLEKPKDKRRAYFYDLLVVMERGLGKRTRINAHPLQKRGGIGVKAAHVTEKTGKIIVSQLVTHKIDQVVITSKKAQVIKLPLKNIPRLGRDTQGVILMRFSKPDDAVASVTCLPKEKP